MPEAAGIASMVGSPALRPQRQPADGVSRRHASGCAACRASTLRGVQHSRFLAVTGPEPLPRNSDCLNRIGRAENMGIPAAFALDPAQRVAAL